MKRIMMCPKPLPDCDDDCGHFGEHEENDECENYCPYHGKKSVECKPKEVNHE